MTDAADEIAAYLDAMPEKRRAAIDAIRAEIKASRPDVAETFLHKMLSYEVPARPGDALTDGGRRWALSVANQKRHMAVYGCHSTIIETYHAQLSELFDMGKYCIRFGKLTDERFTLLREVMDKELNK